MGDDVNLRRALEASEEQAEPAAEEVEAPDPVEVAGVKFIKFMQQDRQRRARCVAGGPPKGALPIPDFEQ